VIDHEYTPVEFMLWEEEGEIDRIYLKVCLY